MEPLILISWFLGGCSGIGLEAARLLARKKATVHVIDLSPFPEQQPDNEYDSKIRYWRCDVTDWLAMKHIFDTIGCIDMAFANAGVSENPSFIMDLLSLDEPRYDRLIDVNFRAVLIVIKLAAAGMNRHGIQGSIVLTSSATAYAPEASLPVYSALKLGVVGLVRSLRSTLIRSNITINAVAPAATITSLLPRELAAPIIAAGLPVSSARFVGRALVYSAVANQSQAVEIYGKDKPELLTSNGRWNGRVILTLGESYTEMEEILSGTKGHWFGEENLRLTNLQQTVTDFGA